MTQQRLTATEGVMTTTERRVSDAEGMLSRHDNGLVQLDHAVRRFDQRGPCPAAAHAEQPAFGANHGANF